MPFLSLVGDTGTGRSRYRNKSKVPIPDFNSWPFCFQLLIIFFMKIYHNITFQDIRLYIKALDIVMLGCSTSLIIIRRRGTDDVGLLAVSDLLSY